MSRPSLFYDYLTGESDPVDNSGSNYPAAKPDVPGGAYDPETSDEDTSSSGDSEIEMVDTSGFPFLFNPPMHPDARMVRVDLGGSTKRHLSDTSAAWFDESGNKYESDSARVQKDGSATKFEKLRLGRIVMGDMTVSAAMLESETRFGFRFMYNPTTFAGGLNVGTDFIPSQQSTGAYVLQSGLEQMTFEILLNRIPDVQQNAKKGDYLPEAITQEDVDGIQERGTHYDLDFLYRCANGLHNTRSRENTGDIGLLLPNPCNLILGPYTSKGAVVSVQVDDQMFSHNMVPILSYVTITFARFLATTPDETTRLSTEAGIQESGGSSDGSTPVSEDETGSNAPDLSEKPKPGPNALNGNKVYETAKGAGFTPKEADTMTQIAYKESGWNANALNDNPSTKDLSYGLWQINMKGSLGPDRRKKYGLKKNEDLWDPATNARAARGIYKDAGNSFTPWSTYNNGSYRAVKMTWHPRGK